MFKWGKKEPEQKYEFDDTDLLAYHNQVAVSINTQDPELYSMLDSTTPFVIDLVHAFVKHSWLMDELTPEECAAKLITKIKVRMKTGK